MSYSKKALRRECRENGLKPMRDHERPVYRLQCQLGRHYYKKDHASKGDVSKHKVGDTFRVSDYPYRGLVPATVIEVHRTDEGFVYKIKVKRTGQAEKEELVKEYALEHIGHNYYNPQQYYLDYHKRKEQEALGALVKAKDEPKGLKGFLRQFHLCDQYEANEEGNVPFLVPKSSSCPYSRIYIYSNHIGLERYPGQGAEVEFYDSKEELAALLCAQETSLEAFKALFEKVKAAALRYLHDDVSEAGFMLKQGLIRAIECVGEDDVNGAMRALKEAEKFA